MKLDIVRQKKRFEMLDKSTRKEVLKICNFFKRYELTSHGKIKKVYTYYDTDKMDLFKSGIALFRTDINKQHTLTMTLERLYSEDNRNLKTYRNKKNVIDINSKSSIFKYTDFLRNSFLDMFNSSINFDPDFLLKGLHKTYVIETISREYRCTNGVGLKTTFSFDQDTFINNILNLKATGDYLTVYQHSKESTDEEYANLISKLIRYCKTITPIKESKVEIARRLTSKAPEKKPKNHKKISKPIIEEQKVEQKKSIFSK